MNNEKQTPDNGKDWRLTRRGRILRTAAIAVASLALGAGTAKAYEASQYHEVGATQATVDPGETLIGTVGRAVDTIAKQQGFDANKVPGEVAEAQEVGGEIEDQTGKETVDPGTAIDVTVSKNDFGKYRVEADPSDAKN